MMKSIFPPNSFLRISIAIKCDQTMLYTIGSVNNGLVNL